MTEKSKIRLDILFKLGFTVNENTSLVHKKGAEIAHYELESLDEIQFLKTIHFILTATNKKCTKCNDFSVAGKEFVCNDCGHRTKEISI